MFFFSRNYCFKTENLFPNLIFCLNHIKKPLLKLHTMERVGSNLSTRDVLNHDLSTQNGSFDRSHKNLTICWKFVQNVITRGKRCRTLGRGSLGACYRSQTFARPSLQYCGHCTSLKNNVSIVKNNILANCSRHKFLTDHNLENLPIFKSWAICQKFHSTHFSTQTFLTNCTDPKNISPIFKWFWSQIIWIDRRQ